MIKPLTLAAGLASALLSTLSPAYEYGEYAAETLDTLINEYPGRYRGTSNFAGASDWMAQRMGTGYSSSRQNFSWVAAGESRSSQNLIAESAGVSGRNLIIGAHFDTYYGRPALQGLDDNGSGAGVMTEMARNLSGISFEDGVTFIGFGAEEEGLRGSRAYVAALDAEARSRLTGMINLDSLITGDMMYAHAGRNSVAAPALAALREQAFRIADELDIALYTNPGLNADYPAGTGCCSDGDSFLGLGVPVLYLEATNWNIGDLDGYDQTTNPAIPNGATWHNPDLDNEAVLVGAFGAERIAQRLRDYSRLLTRLVLEATHTDLRYSALSGAALLGTLEDTLTRQQQTLSQLHDRQWLSLRAVSREVGSVEGTVGVGGEALPSDGFDTRPGQRSRQANAFALGDVQLRSWANLGASLNFIRGTDELDGGGKVRSDTWQGGLYAQLNDGGPLWLNADLSGGRSDFDLTRSVFIQGNGGPVLLDQRLSGDTNATSWGARLLTGYDLISGSLRTGPLLGIDYRHYKIDGFSDDAGQRTAMRFGDERFDSTELSLGWQARASLTPRSGLVVQPYASLAWIEELSDGFSDEFTLTSQLDGSMRRVSSGREVDKHFARARLGAQVAINDDLGVYAEANGRLLNSDGDQTGYGVGVQYRF